MITTANKLLDKAEIPFILFWEFMLIIRMINVYTVIPSKFDSMIFAVISLVGGVYLLRNSINWIQRKQKFSILLILFSLVLVITSLVNGPAELASNIKLIIWQVLFFFVVYEIGKKDEKKLYPLFEKMLVFTWFILVVISLAMFFTQYSFTAPLEKLYYGIRIGFVENRLYGVFVDPNYAATISVIAICFSGHLYKEAKNTRYKVFLIVSIVLQFLFMVLSGSRTATIEIMAIAIVGAFFYYYHNQRNSTYIKRWGYSVAAAIIVVVGVSAAMTITQKAAITSANAVSKIIVIKSNDGNVSLAREDVGENADVSNSRFKLWRSAYEIFESTPLLGTAPRNMVPYAQKHLPDTWIAEKEQTPHNFVFYLLATTGLLGTIPFVLFIVYSMIKTVICLFKMNVKNYYDYLYQSMIALTILISACLITDIVLVNKLGTMIFFLYLGRLETNSRQETSELKI